MRATRRARPPAYLSPLPPWLEEFALRYAWVIVAVNLAGTAFGIYYYLPQFSIEPVAAWPLVPDSPTATLFIALSLALWKLGRSSEYVNMLAFFGCIKLGLWTPYVLAVFSDAFAYHHWAMYNFLFWGHLGMVVQAFLIHRYSDFPVRAVAVAAGFYALNDLVDYFVPVVGHPHHTIIPAERVGFLVYDHSVYAHDVAAAGAVVLTLAATFLALATRSKLVEARATGSP